jgi:hypothetical protein
MPNSMLAICTVHRHQQPNRPTQIRRSFAAPPLLGIAALSPTYVANTELAIIRNMSSL